MTSAMPGRPNPPPPLAFSMGEPAGVGPELALKIYAGAAGTLPTFFAVAPPDWMAHVAKGLALPAKAVPISAPEEAEEAFRHGLPVLPPPESFGTAPVFGKPDASNARAVLSSIEESVRLIQAGRAAALVTGPIQKESLLEAGFPHPGHTEFLAELAGPGQQSVMMLANSSLRVVPVTVHIPLAEVPRRLTSSLLDSTARITHRALMRDFGLTAPRLWIAGLNPHAGEGGKMGREEIEVMMPVIEGLRADGIDVAGPVAADTMFRDSARERYDVALCAYHDQALIPVKTIDFHATVNVTLGLPFVRTSPDHGTALDIAGTGKANARSLTESLRLAARMAESRRAEAA
ncbi:MAG: 4-hydroxythreonine-4-phosphate dehydrogenase PdxA [Alphaproteobacteria bacterium]|nr:4-hydroxythreonine-4-phosphate dehydrogenase PdxA [Alphaproteobacteria bacterium]